MRRVLFAGALAVSGLALLAAVVPARALVIAPPPGPVRAAKAEVIVVGRIIAIEEKDVSAPQFPKAPQNVNYRIAVVSVGEAIKGAKDAKTIRLGFIPPPQAGKGKPPFIRPGIGRFNVSFTVGQDGMFFLTKHHKENFYTAPMYFDFVNGENPNFKNEVRQAKLAVKIGNNPQAALKSKDNEERFFAAAMLIDKYRPFVGPQAKTEAIDAAESKLILTALLGADWKQGGPGFGQFHPFNLFNRLGPKEGWIQPQGNIDNIYDAAKEWLRKNADSYRIQRIIGGGTTGPNTGPGPIRPPAIKLEPKN
jgi:hypothetical protein